MSERSHLYTEALVEDTELVRGFFERWHIYSKIVDLNYMCHREVYGELDRFLGRRAPRGFSLLDLGCGDARSMPQVLQGKPIARYVGVDITPVALDLARKNMAPLECRKDFVEGDYFTFVEETREAADIIWIGLSFHHLTHPQKADFLAATRRLLGKRGHLVICEPTTGDGESRDAYIERWSRIVEHHWTALSPEELEPFLTHVREADYPESFEDLSSLGREQGFAEVESLYRDERELLQMIAFHA
jgi:SAM-dependent methyltransferase